MAELNNIKVSIQEKNEIKKDSPDTLPLNPTAQGFSGQEVRRRLSKSLVGEKGSLLSLVIDKMEILSLLLHSILDESDDDSIIEQLKKKLPKDGSESMEGNLNMDGNEITGADNIRFNRGTSVGGLGDNDFTIILNNGETFTFSENGLNMFLRKLTDVAKGVNSKDGANMENIADIESDVNDLETEIGNIKDGTTIVKKAEQDKNGNDIVETYETKAIVSGIDSRVTNLDSSKLNKGFTSLIEEISLSLSDLFVVDKGSGARKVSLGTLASYLITQELELFTIVDELPNENQNTNTIYLLVTENEEGQNQLLEYIWIADQERWELIGSLEVDLSNYYTKAEVNGLFEDKVDKVEGKGLSTNDYTNTDKQSVEKIPTIEQDILDLESDKVGKNNAITAGTKTKITYDAKGLVTAGDDLVPSDIGAVEEALNDGKTYARKNKGWVELQSGFLPDEETITLNGNDELEATNVAIWRYE